MTSIHLINPAPRAITPGQADDAVMQLEQDFVEIVREELGMHEVPAQALASALVRGMRKRYGGMRLGGRGHIYVPAPSKSERDEAIRQAYNGTNAAEVMKAHGIRRSRLFEIVSARPAGAARIGVSGPKSPLSPHESGPDNG
ncbi:hypothetical protein [Acidovorax sp. A1169]|uniref:hypothetical protein n=1 Tax=Acidovorax sp. A1169 TaxID=3059524 RepID=UPI002737FD85|nr:hypothetical protein [Acidovorax sp. A1169]MDP4074209.1 hypothetical protein [Acidovorax sp. A1169]